MSTRRRYTRRDLAGLAGASAVAALAAVVLQRNGDPIVDLADRQAVHFILDDAISPHMLFGEPDLTFALFTDYRCPICRSSNEALMKVASQDGRLRVLFKEWPILGDTSRAAAITALSADRQGLYAPVRSALLQAAQFDRSALEQIVSSAGGDWASVEANLNAPPPQILAQLTRAQTDALVLGLRGTPAYLANTLFVEGALTTSELERMIDQARTGRSLATAGPMRSTLA